jgi:uncharacterized protein YndB with AHSA1/START domain
MAEITKTYLIDAPLGAVWAALTDPAVIERWGGGPVTMAPELGFEFALWGGDVHGTVVELTPGRSMLQEWYGGEWLCPSMVRFTLTAERGGWTRLELEHTDVPDAEVDEFDDGWDEFYLGPLQELVEDEAAERQ